MFDQPQAILRLYLSHCLPYPMHCVNAPFAALWYILFCNRTEQCALQQDSILLFKFYWLCIAVLYWYMPAAWLIKHCIFCSLYWYR